MLSGLILAAAIQSTMVPPNEMVEDHSHPGHWTQPTIRRFERQPEDDDRRLNWDAYVRELDALWQEYRNADSTPRAWKRYILGVKNAKHRYIYQDPYYAPVLPVQRDRYDYYYSR